MANSCLHDYLSKHGEASTFESPDLAGCSLSVLGVPLLLLLLSEALPPKFQTAVATAAIGHPLHVRIAHSALAITALSSQSWEVIFSIGVRNSGQRVGR